MNKTVVLGISISLCFGVVCYVASNNWIVSLLVFIASLAYFLIVIRKRFKNYHDKINLFYESFHFINNFIISLNIKGSISGAYESSMSQCSEEIKEVDFSIRDLMDSEKIVYLKRIFYFRSYQLFADLIDLWCEQGGNILEMTSHLTNELRDEEETISFIERDNNKYLVEFSVLWLFSLMILFILRYVLNEFYSLICKQTFYPVLIGVFFLLIIGSIELLTKKMTSIDLKEVNNEK